MVYSIAGVNFKINLEYNNALPYLAPYLVEGEPEFEISAPKEEIESILDRFGNGSRSYAEFLVIASQISKTLLLKKNGLLFHSSAIAYKDSAILFSAPSGTGKSTHAKYWKETFDKDVAYINDDKPFIRLENGEFYVYGSPWSGKHGLANNVKVKLKVLCFIERGKETSVEEVDQSQIVPLFMEQVLRFNDEILIDNLFALLNEFFEKVKIVKIKCANDKSSAKIVFDEIKEFL